MRQRSTTNPLGRLRETFPRMVTLVLGSSSASDKHHARIRIPSLSVNSMPSRWSAREVLSTMPLHVTSRFWAYRLNARAPSGWDWSQSSSSFAEKVMGRGATVSSPLRATDAGAGDVVGEPPVDASWRAGGRADAGASLTTGGRVR